jgi:hypothetical protein
MTKQTMDTWVRIWLGLIGNGFLMMIAALKTFDYLKTGCVSTGRSGVPTCETGALIFVIGIWLIVAASSAFTWWTLRKKQENEGVH